VRNALQQEPIRFDDIRSALKCVSTRLSIPLERWRQASALLHEVLCQRSLYDFSTRVLT
jgi:hypothetical protein